MHKNARQNAKQPAHADLKRRMADEFLEFFLIRQRLLQLGKQVDELVQKLRLLARFEPDAHCVVHDDNRHDHADGEWKRTQPI